MRRRAFLGRLAAAAASGGVGAVAGCVTRAGGPWIVYRRLEPHEPRRRRKERPVVVEFDDEDGEIRVTGFVWYGSSSCDGPGLADATYRRASDTLRVVLSPRTDRFSLACTGDLAGTRYRAAIGFVGGLPGTVAVTEHNAGGAPTERRTVNRKEQHERCTGAHPPGSAAAERAHWTCPERYLQSPDGE